MGSNKTKHMRNWIVMLLGCLWRKIRQPINVTTSSIYYRTSLRVKILVPILLAGLLALGLVSWFAFTSLYSTIAGIYEQRARSVAMVVSKSIQQKEYILYYSDAINADIDTLLKRYDSIVGITVIGMTGRGLQVVASTDSSSIGQLLSEDDRYQLSAIREVQVSPIRSAGEEYLRADYPLFAGADLVGIVSIDMSLNERQKYLTKLTWQLGLAFLAGFVLLGGLLYPVLQLVITRPISRLAKATRSISERNYDVEVSPGPARKAGVRVHDEIARLISVFNLMTKVIRSREQALSEMVALDELTGTYNLSHFQRVVEQELSKGRRYKHPTSLLLVEVRGAEHLKKRDKERILIGTANFLTAKLRAVDPIFRVSDYRFVALLPETPSAGARVARDRLERETPDLILLRDLSLTLLIKDVSWSEQDTPQIEDALRQVQLPLDRDQG